ncbi:hypothetical protein F5B17DRAFT_451641 [Nemania serpens]|nr:hypothetical protein F5B17DRAFT_451641 [Nemania serpens]
MGDNSRESSHAELLESPPINPWIMEQMRRPNFQYSRVVPDCKRCRFTFYSADCQETWDGSFRCLRCLGMEDLNNPVRPFCWGRNHAYTPIPLEHSYFRPRVSRIDCRVCYDPSLPNAGLDDGPPYRRLPRCEVPQNKVIYECMVPLIWTGVAPPEQEMEMKMLLISWLDYLRHSARPHPTKCLNCSDPISRAVRTGLCRLCKADSKPRRWNDFKPCQTCGHFGRVEDFVSAKGREQFSCRHCLQICTESRRRRSSGAGDGARGNSVQRRHRSSGVGDGARSGAGGGAGGHGRSGPRGGVVPGSSRSGASGGFSNS